MIELLYKQLKKNWRYVHPITKILANIDYFTERLNRNIHQLTKVFIKRIEVKKV